MSGPNPLSEEIPVKAAKSVLEHLTTIQGMPYDEWLMNLTPKQIKRLMRPPRQRQQTVFIDVAPEGASEMREIPLSLDAWKWTTEGWAVYQREGQERFEEWATVESTRLYKFKTMSMTEFHNLVSHEIGPNRARLERAQTNLAVKRVRLECLEKEEVIDKKAIHKLTEQINNIEKGKFFYTGGVLHRGVTKGKDEFFIEGCYAWEQIPPAFCDRRQRLMNKDRAAFRQRQEDFFNTMNDL